MQTAVIEIESPTTWSEVATAYEVAPDVFARSLRVSAMGDSPVLEVSFFSDDGEHAVKIVDGVMTAYRERASPPSVVRGESKIVGRLDHLVERKDRIQADIETAEDANVFSLSMKRLDRVNAELVDTQILLDDTRARHTAESDRAPLVLTSAAPGHNDESPSNQLLMGSLLGAMAGGGLAWWLARQSSSMVVVAGRMMAELSSPYQPVGSAWEQLAKRCIDVVVATIALVILSPCLVGIAIAIKVTSKGPILFRQDRVGWRGVPFRINKFRTMKVNNDDTAHREFVKSMVADSEAGAGPEVSGGIYKLVDPRVTGIGRVLRKYSLDELPQLWNVITGDMSLVGPRPSLPWEHDLYLPLHRGRVRAKPGCSGLWQVSGHNRLTVPEMLDLDIEYVDRWSILLDAKILFRTPLTVLGSRSTR